MAIYFDLMALDQQERERRQRALQEAGRIGLQAYMQGRTQDREDAVANLQMGQAANNQSLIRSTLEGRGATWADNSVARANEPVERPQLDQQMRQVAMEPVVAQQPIQSNAYMDAVRQEEQLPYWKNATPKQREAALGVLAERFAPVTAQQPIQNSMVRDRSREPIPAVNIRESMPIMNRPNALPVADVPTMRRPVDARTVSAEMPEMQQVKLDNPRQAAQRTGLPVKEIVTVRNSVNRSGIRGADGSEYVANFEDAWSTISNPRTSQEEKILALGRFDAQDKMISEYYGDNQASQYMRQLLMTGLGGKGGNGAGGKDWQITDENGNAIGDTRNAPTAALAVVQFKKENPNYKNSVVLANKLGSTTGEPDKPLATQKLIAQFNEADPKDQLAYLQANKKAFAKMGLGVKKSSGGFLSSITPDIVKAVFNKQERLELVPLEQADKDTAAEKRRRTWLKE